MKNSVKSKLIYLIILILIHFFILNSYVSFAVENEIMQDNRTIKENESVTNNETVKENENKNKTIEKMM